MAKDKGTPSLSGTTTITLNVIDVNDHAPVFSRSSVTVHIKEGNSKNIYTAEVSFFSIRSSHNDIDNIKVTYSQKLNTKM